MSPAAPTARGGTEAVIAGEGVVSLPPRPAGSPGPPGAGCRGGEPVPTLLSPAPRPSRPTLCRGRKGAAILVLRQRPAPALQSSSTAGEASLSLKTADDNDPNLVIPGDVFI